MRTLEALKILEDAALQCKRRNVNTVEVRGALDLLEPRVQPEWLIPQFRAHLNGTHGRRSSMEEQEQVLRASIPGIRIGVHQFLGRCLDTLARRCIENRSPEVKAALEWLRIEREKLEQPWKLVSANRRFSRWLFSH
jgi:hypothetical protein